MFDHRFYSTRLGQAALASVSAMVIFVALSTQMPIEPVYAMSVVDHAAMVEVA